MDYSKYPKLQDLTSSSTLRAFLSRSVPASVQSEMLDAALILPELGVRPAPIVRETALGGIAGISFTFVYPSATADGTDTDPQMVLAFDCASVRWSVDEYLQLREIVVAVNAQLNKWMDDRLIVSVNIEPEETVLRRQEMGTVGSEDRSAVKFILNRTEEESAFLTISLMTDSRAAATVRLGRDELNDLEEMIVRADRLFRLVPALHVA